MLGQNPKRPPIIGNGKILEVKNIFKSIQGEGPFVGTPAIFIRLGGCNLACSFCDTNFEEFNQLSIDNILQQVKELSINSKGEKNIKLIVLTGGEPFRQPIELLCYQLMTLDFMVQIETNGTLFRPLPKEIFIVCSPKASKNGYSAIRNDLLPHISAIKFLVAKNILEYSYITEVGQSQYNIPVFIQPMDQDDEQLNKDNQQKALELSLESGYRLSIQVHKVLGIQ